MTGIDTIWKFTLRVTDQQLVLMPVGAKVLSVQVQAGVVCLWAQVNVSSTDRKTETEERRFEIHGTGNPMEWLRVNERREFIGTVQQGQFVWHVFEIVK